MNEFTLIENEKFIVEINQALDDIKFIISGDGSTKANVAAATFNTHLATSATEVIDAATRVDGTNLSGTTNTGFIKNYLYPAYLFTCAGNNDETVGLIIEGEVSSTKYYQSFKCKVKK